MSRKKVILFDPAFGIAGDIFVANIFNLFPELIDKANKFLNLLNVNIKINLKNKNGFSAYMLDIENKNNDKVFKHFSDFEKIAEKIKDDNLKNIFINLVKNLFEAEALIHTGNKKIENNIHLHEIGAIDTIVDLYCASLFIDKKNKENIYCVSLPLTLSNTFTSIIHGIVSTPVPAVTINLENISIRINSKINTEITTPTGLVILKNTVDKWVEEFKLNVEKVSVSMGTRTVKIDNKIVFAAFKSYLGTTTINISE